MFQLIRIIIVVGPSYLCSLCCRLSDLEARRVLRSATRGELLTVGHVKLCSEGPFRLWVHQHRMIFPLNCVLILVAHPSKVFISPKSFFFVRDWVGSASEL